MVIRGFSLSLSLCLSVSLSVCLSVCVSLSLSLCVSLSVSMHTPAVSFSLSLKYILTDDAVKSDSCLLGLRAWLDGLVPS